MPDKGVTNTEAVGRIAYSTAGRDKKRAFVIVGICEEERESGMVYIADGALRKIDTPKKKKLRHLRICDESVDLTDADDETLREYLKSY